MKRGLLFTVASFFFHFTSWAQEELKDTIKLIEVEIKTVNAVKELSTLDSASLENPFNANLGELLNKESHLFIKSYGIGSLATISLRGSGSSHTQLYWNGIAINSSMNGASDLSLYPLSFLDKVELNYGLKSLSYGSGGIGGAIELKNQVNFQNKHTIQLGTGVGSFGKRAYSAKIELGNQQLQSVTKILYHEAKNNFEYKDLTLEGFPLRKVRNASLEQKGIMQAIHYRWKEKHLLEAFIWWFDSDRNLPPLITLRENVEHQSDQSLRGLLSYKRYYDRFTFNLKSSFLKEELRYQNNRANISNTTTTNSIKSIAQLDYQSHANFNWLAKVNVDINQAESPALIETVQQERISAYGAFNYNNQRRLSLKVALRQEYILEEDQFTLPSILIDYKLIKKWGLGIYALAGRNLKYPTLNDLYWQPFGNENLKPETANNLELGFNFSNRVFDNAIRISNQVSFFAADIKNYIQWRPTAFGYWTPQNLNKVATRGIEFALRLEHEEAKKLKKKLGFNYSYTSSLNRQRVHEFDQSVGKQLIYIPEHKLNLSLAFEYASWQLDFNYQLIGERYTTSDDTERLPLYKIVDLNLGKTISLKNHKVVAKFSVLNLFDEEYQAIEWRPMPNRNYLLTLKYQVSK